MRVGRLRGRHIVALVVALGIVLELPLLVYILNRSDETTTLAAPQNLFGSASTTLPLHPVAGNFEPDDTTLPECSEQTCYEQAYGNVAFYQGPKAAMALVEQQYGGGADPTCHRIVHAIGAAALARNKGNVARTFAEGSSTCWSGYYHGVLERAFIGVKSYDADALGGKARGLCADRQVRKSTWLTYQCLHGLGHGLMITTGYQLPLSLKVCKRLPTNWDRTSCKGGVFMENILTSYGGQSPYVRDDDPMYPCNWVARVDKYSCYQQATTRFIRVVGVDWEKLAQLCSQAEADFVLTCFGSFGQNASVVSFRDVNKIVPICAVARRHGGEAECFSYAAMDIAGTYSGGSEAAVLCNSSPATVRGSCYEAIGRMIRHLRQKRAAQRAECRSTTLSQRYVSRCIAGTLRTSSIPGLAR